MRSYLFVRGMIATSVHVHFHSLPNLNLVESPSEMASRKSHISLCFRAKRLLRVRPEVAIACSGCAHMSQWLPHQHYCSILGCIQKRPAHARSFPRNPRSFKQIVHNSLEAELRKYWISVERDQMDVRQLDVIRIMTSFT